MNSSHHQAIRVPGDKLLVSAVSPQDGVIEAVELDAADHFVLGVQWHPERTYTQSAFSRAIFAAFVQAAAEWQAADRLKSRSPVDERRGRLAGLSGSTRCWLRRAWRLWTPGRPVAFEDYLSLFVRWNARVNLTSIRDEEGILSRHFVESIACARALPAGISTLLDFGSGGGFPGIPIALCRPEIAVTLAESQGKKAAFLQEAVRVLGISAKVHAQRAETADERLRLRDSARRRRMAEAVKAAARAGDAGRLAGADDDSRRSGRAAGCGGGRVLLAGVCAASGWRGQAACSR